MIENSMFKHLWFCLLMLISSVVFGSAGSLIFMDNYRSSLTSYIGLYLLVFYILTSFFNNILAKMIYTVYMIVLSIMLYHMDLVLTPSILLFIAVPLYSVDVLNIRAVSKVEAMFGRKQYLTRLQYNVVMGMSTFAILSVLGLLCYLGNTEYMYDICIGILVSLTLYYTKNHNDLHWAYRCLYSVALLLFFNSFHIDKILLLMEGLKSILSFACFFERKYEQEKLEELRNKLTKTDSLP